MARPKQTTASVAEQQLNAAAASFDNFQQSISDLTHDRLNETKREETEGPRVSQREIQKAPEVHLRPKREIYAMNPKTGEGQKFNEKFRADYEHAKQEVNFMAENKEIGGEDITIWTRPFGGMPAEEWIVPVNKPVWGPRYLAEQIKRKYYHRLVMKESVITGSDHRGQYFGSLAADTTIQRLDCHPVSQRRSLFMGASGF